MKNRNVHLFACLCLVLPCHLPPLSSPILSACRYKRAAVRLTPPQPSVSVSKRSDMQLKFERASLALLTHTFSFMHALTQVAPCSDSSPQLIWSIKQGRLAGLHCDTSFALRGEVTVIGVPFKGSASPGRMLSKLTAFAGFHFAKLTGRRSAFSYGTTSSALKTIIIFFLCLQHHLDLV